MQTTKWHENTINNTALKGLLADGHQYNFYKAVHLLTLHGSHDHHTGEKIKPSIRFCAAVDFGFPATPVTNISLKQHDDQPCFQVDVSFMSLGGALGPLPYEYSQLILNRVNDDDAAMKDFLDIFHHQLMEISYVAKMASVPCLDPNMPTDKKMTRPLFALGGYNDKKDLAPTCFNATDYLNLLPLFTGQHDSSFVIKTVIQTRFNVPVSLDEFMGKWVSFDPGDYVTLSPNNDNRQLGKAIIGTQCWDQSAAISLTLGPVSYEQFKPFLPDKEKFLYLLRVLDYLIQVPLQININFLLDPMTINPDTLGKGTQLGWNSWLNSEDPALYTHFIRLHVVE